MEGCVLQPPNSQLLSDDVIGDVMQRSKRSRRTFDAYEGGMDTDTGSLPSQHPRLQSWSSDSPEYRETRAPSTNHSTGRMKTQESSRNSKLTMRDDQLRAMADMVIADKLRLRELRRVRQIRYRKKKEDYTANLDKENRKLRDEVDQLEQRRRSVSAAIPAKKSAWNVVVEYFRQFQYGVREPLSTSSPSSETQPSAQLDFLLASMTPGVMYNAEQGAEAMMKSWRCISRWFTNVELKLNGLEMDATGSLVAATITSVTISERTIRNVFPHLCRSDRRGKTELSPLAEKLLGQRIVMHGSAHFEWDSAFYRVVSVRSRSDMLTPMLRVLGSLENLSRVFDKALITLDFRYKQKTKLDL